MQSVFDKAHYLPMPFVALFGGCTAPFLSKKVNVNESNNRSGARLVTGAALVAGYAFALSQVASWAGSRLHYGSQIVKTLGFVTSVPVYLVAQGGEWFLHGAKGIGAAWKTGSLAQMGKSSLWMAAGYAIPLLWTKRLICKLIEDAGVSKSRSSGVGSYHLLEVPCSKMASLFG